jgi:hypothetical protein
MAMPQSVWMGRRRVVEMLGIVCLLVVDSLLGAYINPILVPSRSNFK